jgi:hypothetical protein
MNFTKNSDTIMARPTFPTPFDTLRFNKVIAYEFDGRMEHGETVFDIERGWFHETIESQLELSSEDIMTLTTILTNDATYGESIMACFEPKLGFIFYQDQKPNAVIDICLDCNYLKSSIPFPETNYPIITFESGGERPEIGFTTKAVAEIVAFCADLNLNYGSFKP